MWGCSSERCHRWNWPGRVECSACGLAKASTARRRLEEWEVSRLPRWAMEEAAPPPRRPPAHADVGHRRVPGMGPGAGGGHGRFAAAGGGTGGPTRLGLDPRRNAPGVLDGGGRAEEGGGGRGGGDGQNGTNMHDGEWVSVVRGGGGRRGERRGGGDGSGGMAGGGNSGGGAEQQRQQQQQTQGHRPSRQLDGMPQPADQATGADMGEGARSEEGRQAPQPKDLPPMRLVDIPTMSRKAIAKKVEAAAEKIGRLQERGVEEARLHRAREAKDRLVKELRAAGGATEKTLSFTIKGEDDKVERAERALRKAIEDKQRKEARIAELQAELLEDEEGISRHRQRLQRAREYREHLTTQKMVEAASERTLQHLKTLASAMSPQDPQQAQAQAWALRAVELGTWREEVDMAGGDTDSEEGEDGGAGGGSSVGASERTRLDLSRDGARTEAGDENGGNEELVQRLVEARRRLEAIQRERSEALSRVDGPLGGDNNKRDREGEIKTGDRDGDVDMVPPLTGIQVHSLFAERMLEAEEQVRHCQILLSREEVLPPVASGGGMAARAMEEPPPVRAPAEPSQTNEGRRTAGQGGEGDRQEEDGQRGRPRRRPGYDTWVTAEEWDEAQAAEQRRQQHLSDGRRQPPQRPRTASREGGPGRCRWTMGARRTTAARQRSASARPAGGEAWEEVEREFRRQQRAGEDLEGRVRDNLQVAQQERMQQVQEAERRQMAMARVSEAARGVEARLGAALEGTGPRELPSANVGGEAGSQAVPTFGPTGQRLDEQQHLLRAAAAGAAADRRGVAVRPPSVPRRKTRWGDESEAEEEEGARERSQRGTRGPRLGRGAMED